MATLFNTLGVGYSGLNVAQVGVNVTGQNISNAETDGYSRKRVVQSAATPIFTAPGNMGNGVEIDNIERIFDNFVYRRYTASYSDKENSDYKKKTLDELSTYFPEVDDVGIKADLKEFYNLWQRFADNPNDNAIKMDLAQRTQTLSDHIHHVNSQVYDMQERLNQELKVNVDEVNKIAQKIASINNSIAKAESADGYTANDLRDKRGVLERDLSRLIGASVSVEGMSSNINLDSSANKIDGNYSIHVNGFNIVDGSSYHPIVIDNKNSANGFYDLYYERQDGVLVPIDEKIRSGKIGAILDLRGSKIDKTTGMPSDGVIQDVYDNLNGFAKSLINSTNNIYANVATTNMVSNQLKFNPDEPLVNSGLDINEGSFDIVIYDINGNEVSSRTINIDASTTLTNTDRNNSIEYQLQENKDDDNDGNANNDIDDMIVFSSPDGNSSDRFEISLSKTYQSMGYTFAIKDNLKSTDFSSGTNFAGALGLNKFFDGENATNIDLAFDFKQDPTKISAGASEITGDNSVALDMVQHQFEKYDFKIGNSTVNDTHYGFFDTITSDVGIKASAAATANDTITAQFNAVELEYQSVSKVNIDEEMTNLIRYQSAYGAAAKVITTVDQMLNTLLGIKQ